MYWKRSAKTFVIIGTAATLALAGCGGDDDDSTNAAPAPVETETEAPAPAETPTPAPEVAPAPAPDSAPAPAQAAAPAPAPEKKAKSAPAPKKKAAAKAPAPKKQAAPAPAPKGGAPAPAAPGPAGPVGGEDAEFVPPEATETDAPSAAPAGGNGGATDVGVTGEEVKLGGIFMYGYALGNLAIQPMHREMQAIIKAVNDSGGIHGRRFKYIDCDDGAPDPARTAACYKKLVDEEKVFAFMGGATFTEAQFQADSEKDKLPQFAPVSLYREVWQNPYAFPIHMDMTQEALGNGDWVMKTHNPETFGIICLNNAEMKAACEIAEADMTKRGAEQVFKRIYQPGTPDMSGDIIAARTANPDHILHYTVDPTVTARFFLDAQQQNYWPPKGVSGNHMALEIIGGLIGEYPAKGGYWTNTTYKLWGADYIAFQRKYAPNNKGLSHHVTQGQWFGANIAMECFRRVGPNLTREAMVQCHNSQLWATGPSLGQKFAWDPEKRYQAGSGNTKEYMFHYISSSTQAEDDGTGKPLGLVPAEIFELNA
ncbi:MAG: ABC transporter substrate-binding protein, partial [Acidimicrobiia bacterium]